MVTRVLVLVLLAAQIAWAGEYDWFVHLSPEEQVEKLGHSSHEERIEMMRAIKAVMETDPLTGMRNRRALERARRNTDLVSFISFDLDFFKKINDTYGHDVGDLVLKTVARVAREHLREPAFRLGGEEFLVILEGTPVVDAALVAERLRKALTEIRFPEYPELKVSGSFGVAGGQVLSHEMWEALLKASDEASYSAKTGGRNQVRVAGEKRACEILATK